MNTKTFVQCVLAVLLGLFVWGIVKVILLFMMFGSLVAAGTESAPVMPKEGVLLMDFETLNVSEQSGGSDPMSMLSGGMSSGTVGVLDAVRAIEAAAEDPAVQFILMNTEYASSVYVAEELRQALANFRKSGKAVISYCENFNCLNYYLASVSDKIYTSVHQGGMNTMIGISGRMMFLKDLLDKLGVEYQLVRHGKYKSAGETYIKNAPSPENMQQNQEMIDSMWETIASGIEETRGISVDSLDYIVENLLISEPMDMLKHGLADEALSVEDYKAKLAVLAEKEKYKDVKFISFADYVEAKTLAPSKAKKQIAVIYADGNIVEGSGSDDIAGDRFARIIAKVRADSTIKAVVLRVNSPGGTVVAASKIKDEIDLTRKVKPVVASYGDYAASGGYWISNSCDHIFSNASTLTGSIGVFAAIPNFENTLKDVVHVNMVPVKSHEHSDMLSGFRSMDEEELAWMQESVDGIYTQFVSTVAEGRDMTYEAVDEVAQGRVWTGAEALEIGLVDEIGTLSDAIAYTAALAGDPDLANWNVQGYPKPKSAMEQLMSRFGMDEQEAMATIFDGTPLQDAASTLQSWYNTWNGNGTEPLVFARMPYEIIIK